MGNKAFRHLSATQYNKCRQVMRVEKLYMLGIILLSQGLCMCLF